MRSTSFAPLVLLFVLGGAVVVAQEPPPDAPKARPASPYPQRTTRPEAEPQAVALVDDALDWLARHQEPDGHWSAATWRARCAQGGPCATIEGGFEGGLTGFETGVTALAVLAFLGHGQTAAEGAHAAVVDRALAWLLARQKEDGSIGFESAAAPRDVFGFNTLEHGTWLTIVHIPPPRAVGDPRPARTRVEESFSGDPLVVGWTFYNHVISTLALCEALALGADPARFRAPAERALAFAVFAQNPNLGGHYGVRTGRNDTSMTVWMAQALRAARDAGLDAPAASVEGAFNWLGRIADPEQTMGYSSPGGDALAGFNVQGGRSRCDGRAMTAAGWFVRVLLGAKVPSKDLGDAAKLIVGARPARGEGAGRPVPYTQLYFGASFITLRPQTKDTRAWRREQVALLAEAGQRDACARGSFEPTELWCIAGGRVYATALAALALEAPWRLGGLRAR